MWKLLLREYAYFHICHHPDDQIGITTDATDLEPIVSLVWYGIHVYAYNLLQGNSPNCAVAFYAPEDWYAQRQCETNNVCSFEILVSPTNQS